MIPLVVVSTSWGASSSGLKVMLDEIFTVLRLQPPTSPTGSGMCVMPGMTVAEKLSWGFVTPGLIFVGMILCLLLSMLWQRSCAKVQGLNVVRDEVMIASLDSDDAESEEPSAAQRKKQQPAGMYTVAASTLDSTDDTSSQASVELPGPVTSPASTATMPDSSVSPSASDAPPGVKGLSSSDLPPTPATEVPPNPTANADADAGAVQASKFFSSAITSDWGFPTFRKGANSKVAPSSAVMVRLIPQLPLKTRLKGSALNWFLFTYTSALSATLKLLSCVDVPGSDRKHLFMNASLDCSSVAWMVPLYIVLVVLVGVVIALPFVTVYLHKHQHIHRGMYRALSDPYRRECYWWESVLLSQRLLLSFFCTFLVQYPVFRLVLAGMVCLVCTFLHLSYKPIHSPHGQMAQAVFQFSLLAVIMVNIAMAQLVQDAKDNMSAMSSHANKLAMGAHESLDLLFIYVLPLGALFVAIGRKIARWVAMLVTGSS